MRKSKHGKGFVGGEKDFIQRYLAPLAKGFDGAHGLMDDAATLDVGTGFDVVATVDAVAEGVHFFADDSAADIAWKALAVNVSDLVAKGADPIAYLMSLSFPTPPNDAWMADFCRGLAMAQTVFGIKLAGGDTDRRDGPLAITITALGRVETGKLVARSTGRAGDCLFLTGTLGDAGVGLALRGNPNLQADWQLSDETADFLRHRYLRPKPRNRLVSVLLEYATAAMDISDGLAKDAISLADASGLGLHITCARLPVSGATQQVVAANGVTLTDVLTAGGDYEVLAAVPPDQREAFVSAAEMSGVVVTEIGHLMEQSDWVFEDLSGQPLELSDLGYDHFAQDP